MLSLGEVWAARRRSFGIAGYFRWRRWVQRVVVGLGFRWDRSVLVDLLRPGLRAKGLVDRHKAHFESERKPAI